MFNTIVWRPSTDKELPAPRPTWSLFPGTAFGAFVDVGAKQDGLVHVSQLADQFIKEPTEAVSVHQHVRVRVLEVDVARKRIALSMKGLNG